MKIIDLIVTPIAFRDPALLNSVGVHSPLALRSIVELVVEGGVIGLGEGSGELDVVQNLIKVRDAIVGRTVFDLNGIENAVNEALGGNDGPFTRWQQRVVYSIIDVACHDAQGKILGLPVSELLGGTVRTEVDFSAYLFYKWAAHPSLDGTPVEADYWGAALDPAGVVRQAQKFVDDFGFRSIKLKGGVFEPDQEIAAMRALAEAFPGYPLRLDPNGAWTVETSLYVAEELGETLEYLEDPTLTIDNMSAVSGGTEIPLATNMCVVAFEHIRESFEKDAVQIILSDHHYWGGLRHTRELGAICDTFGIGMAMHSNSHLGISLAAMTHVAAATPNLPYACDTHYPWNSVDDVVVPGVLNFVNGAITVPTTPGLGVELDRVALARQHRVYVDSGRTTRDDTLYMRTFDPQYDPILPRF